MDKSIIMDKSDRSIQSPQKYRATECTYKGKKLVASQTIFKDEVIGYLSGKPRKHSTKISIYSGGIHVDPDNGFEYLNHSCDPNSRLCNGELIAILEIVKDQEITFNYKDNEPLISHPFRCLCGSENCLEVIK